MRQVKLSQPFEPKAHPHGGPFFLEPDYKENIMKDRITQTQQVIDHLITYDTITPLEAQSNYNIWRLAAVIHKLKKAGVPIVSELRTAPSGSRYAVYSFA